MNGSLRLFDCDVSYGRGTTALPREIETMRDLVTELDHCGIDEALVWHRDAFERDFATGNNRLAELSTQPRLHRTMTFLPACCQEMPSEEGFIEQLRANKARAVWAFPAKHSFVLDAVSCGGLLELFMANALPVFVPLPELGWAAIYRLMRDFPNLSLVVTQLGAWGQDRNFRPLMMKYPNFCVTTNRFETGGAVKSLVDRVGYRQLLFGSGLPLNYPGGYILMLARAEIGDEARAAITHGNIERMLGEVPW